jgi:deoxycytidine triphosphate deaminase
MTLSQYAWCKCDKEVYWYKNGEFSINEITGQAIHKKLRFKKGDKPIVFDRKRARGTFQEKYYLLLFPHQTTIVETEEVIGIGSTIGGAVHSKVGVVVQGIGDTGTMLGPGYCGHLMISLHNITDDVIPLQIGTTFISLTFDYLNTQVSRTSSTSSSHYDRLLENGCNLTQDEQDYFREDWKGNLELIQKKMGDLEEFKKLKSDIKRRHFQEVIKYINKRNIIAVLLVILAFVLIYQGALYLDTQSGNSVWVDRFWNVGCSGIVGSFLIALWRFVKGKK